MVSNELRKKKIEGSIPNEKSYYSTNVLNYVLIVPKRFSNSDIDLDIMESYDEMMCDRSSVRRVIS